MDDPTYLGGAPAKTCVPVTPPLQNTKSEKIRNVTVGGCVCRVIAIELTDVLTKATS